MKVCFVWMRRRERRGCYPCSPGSFIDARTVCRDRSLRRGLFRRAGRQAKAAAAPRSSTAAAMNAVSTAALRARSAAADIRNVRFPAHCFRTGAAPPASQPASRPCSTTSRASSSPGSSPPRAIWLWRLGTQHTGTRSRRCLLLRQYPLHQSFGFGRSDARLWRHWRLAPTADATLDYLLTQLGNSRLILGVARRHSFVRRPDHFSFHVMAGDTILAPGQLRAAEGR